MTEAAPSPKEALPAEVEKPAPRPLPPPSPPRASIDAWAIGEGVRIDPLTGKAFEDNAKQLPGAFKGDYRAENLIWDGARKAISIAGAANEVVGFQLIIEGPGAKGISVAASELKGPGGAAIPAGQFAFFRAFYLHVKPAPHAKQLPFPLEEGWYPDPLVPLDTPGKGAPFAIDGGNFTGDKPEGIRNQTVWADLWIPKEQPPGTYRGRITVLSDGGNVELNVAVRVFGFGMPAESHAAFLFESMKYFAKMPTELRNAIFTVAHDHRATMLVNATPDRFEDCSLKHSGGRFDWTSFDEVYGPAISGKLFEHGPRAGVGLPYFNLAFGPKLKRPDKTYSGRAWPIPNPTKDDGMEVDFTPEYVKELTALLKDAAEHFAEKYPKTTITVYQNSLDEAGFHKKKEWAMPQLRSIQGYLRMFNAVGADNLRYQLDIGSGFAKCKFDLDGDGKKERSKDVVDALHGIGPMTWCVSGGRIELDVLEPAKRSGSPIWFYNSARFRVGPTAIGGEGLGLRTWPWVTWNSKIDGMLIWNALVEHQENAWKTGGGYKKTAGFASYVYVGGDIGFPTRAYASMRLKSLRGGKQDYEYFFLLSQLDEDRARATYYSTRAARNTMNERLNVTGYSDEKVAAISPVARPFGDGRHWSHNVEDYEKVRYRVGELLEKGERAPGGAGIAVSKENVAVLSVGGETWRAVEGIWKAQDGAIGGIAAGDGYLYRENDHPDDFRLSMTVRAEQGEEISCWFCGSRGGMEFDGYLLMLKASKVKLKRKEDTVARDDDVTMDIRKDRKVVIERNGKVVRIYIDDVQKPFREWTDPQPLRGENHRTLGFYMWKGAVTVSDCRVEEIE